MSKDKSVKVKVTDNVVKTTFAESNNAFQDAWAKRKTIKGSK
jgi:hypothetical protein